MKPTIFVAAVAILLLPHAVTAAEPADEHAVHHDAPAAAPAPSPAPSASPPPTMAQMHDNMAKMQAMMHSLDATKDPAQRRKLLDEHMQAMQQQMDMMDRAMQSQMIGGPGSQAMNCADMMRGDTDMMKSMVEQMKQHGAAEHGPDAGAKAQQTPSPSTSGAPPSG